MMSKSDIPAQELLVWELEKKLIERQQFARTVPI